jgi:hypothetical protein
MLADSAEISRLSRLDGAAWYAEQSGNVADAKELAVASLKTRRKVLRQEHQDTIRSIAIVADAYSLSGQWDKAEKPRK